MSLGVSCALANLIGESSLANVTVRIDVAMPLHLSGADCEWFLNELSLSSNQSLRILQVSALERTDRPIGKSTHTAPVRFFPAFLRQYAGARGLFLKGSLLSMYLMAPGKPIIFHEAFFLVPPYIGSAR